jgi:rhodanese-related sulfurtransferase
MTKVTVDEVREVLDRDSDRVTIVDSRSADAWGSSDVKAAGAIRVPPDDAEKHISDINRDEYVLTYCS